MTELNYKKIEQQIVKALPELSPAAAYYWKTEGEPGEDCGSYIFLEDIFASYARILLAMPVRPRSSELLQRAFTFVDQMFLSPDPEVRDLAFIGLFEGQENWFFARSRPFYGSTTKKVLDREWPEWRELPDERIECDGSRLLDGFRVRHVIATEMGHEGGLLEGVPGETYANG